MTKLNNVNTTDIQDAIRLGCRTMSSVFNADDNDVPFFGSSLWPHAGLGFHECHSEAHVPGRHLNALLAAEDAVGVCLDESAVEKHARAAFFSYSGPVPLPLNRQEITGPLRNFSPHNSREGFHALYALAAYRDSGRARELAERSIEFILKTWDPQTGWDVRRLETLGLAYQRCQSFVEGEARMLGPLVKYYRATGFGPALKLALALKEKAVSEFFRPEGTYNPATFGTHAHSVTCVMSSLGQLADLMGDATLLDRVEAFYDNGLWELRDEIGWSAESHGQTDTDHGEANNTGDILETALILGRWGHARCYHDAERILRMHLLPCQLRDVSFAEEPENPEGIDALRDVADRHLGAFGFPAPYGHRSIGKGRGGVSFNMDIVGGVVGSLCEAYRDVTRLDACGHHVNLLFDHETDAIKIHSPYTHDALSIQVKKPAPLFVRIPPWTDRDQLRVERVSSDWRWLEGHLFFSEPPSDGPLQIHFPLPEQMITLSRHHIQPIRVKVRGDAVVGMDNAGADFTYFDPLD